MLQGLNVNCAPCGIAVSSDGAILITDTYQKLIWELRDGTCRPYAGADSVKGLYGEPIGGYNDSLLRGSLFKEPWAIAPFLDGWAISDATNNAVRLLRTDHTETVNARSDKLLMNEIGVVFAHPTGLASDPQGNLYVSDTHNGAIRLIRTDGELETYASGLNNPTGLCWRGDALYIAEAGANRIMRVRHGLLEHVAGSGTEDFLDGPVKDAAFSSPQGVTVGEDGTIYVSDTVNGAVRRIRNGMVDTIAMQDGTELRTWPVSPMGLCVYGDSLFVCDNFSKKVFTIPLS